MATKTSNRIQAAIVKMRAQIQQRLDLGMTTKDRVEATGRDLDMDFVEHARFQELKSVAFASGVLNQEEAQTLFRLLGMTPETFNRNDVATKAVLTQAFGELLKGAMSNGR